MRIKTYIEIIQFHHSSYPIMGDSSNDNPPVNTSLLPVSALSAECKLKEIILRTTIRSPHSVINVDGFCPATHLCPLFCQPQSCPPLLVMHPSANLPKTILIYPYPIPANQCPSTPILSCLPFTPCPSPICNFTAYILP